MFYTGQFKCFSKQRASDNTLLCNIKTFKNEMFENLLGGPSRSSQDILTTLTDAVPEDEPRGLVEADAVTPRLRFPNTNSWYKL